MAEFIWGMFVGAFLSMATMSIALAMSAFKNMRGYKIEDDQS